MKRLLAAIFLFAGAAAFGQSYNGSLDEADCSAIAGWAWDSTRPSSPMNVDLYDGSTLIETVAANLYRADLQAAGIGDGHHAFNYLTPASLKDGLTHTINAKISETAIVLGTSKTLTCPSGSTGYQYYYSDPLTSINTNNWIQNGSGTAGSNGYTSSTSGFLISKPAVTPSSTVNYEVRMTLNLTQSTTTGGYVALLRASNDASFGTNTQGTFYAVELANPTFTNGVCSATINAYKVVSGSVTLLASGSKPCHNGTVLRAIMTGWNAILVYVDNSAVFGVSDSGISSGAPGVAVVSSPSGNSISQVQFGPWDSAPPNAINTQTIGASSYPNRVDMQWQGVSDDPNGTGIWVYQIYRQDPAHPSYVYISSGYSPSFSDPTVSPGITYTYLVQPVDFHWNSNNVTFNVVTPPAGSIDPRQTGVRPTGSYWGGGGENIDMRSGNLNFSIPLLKVKGRGWTVPFNLSYNSQNWRQDSGGTWNLGRDRGYGYGWNLQGGALMPEYFNWGGIDHYLFIDSTGAEYRLDQNNGGIWTSKEGIYLEYDSNAGRLYFPDGTFWVFGCTSAGTEEDAGVQYPTLIQDTNGNQITISYAAGQGITWTNSSSRISSINDVLGTYTFAYTLGWFPHLTTISSTYPAENYTFRYLPNAGLYAPFSGGAQFGSAQVLQTMTNTNSQLSMVFSYGSNNSAELTQATFPYGGNLQWAYANATFTGRTQREVQTRYLTMSSGGTQLTYPITHPGDTGTTFRSTTTLTDAAGIGSKVWTFDTTAADAGFGLQVQFDSLHSGTSKSRANPVWTLDSLNRPYMSSVYKTLDPGASSQVQSHTDQTIDQFGNVTYMAQFDYGASSPTRVYNNTYLTDSSPTTVHPYGSNYNAEHVHNRLLTSTVTQNSQTTTLVSNKYDFYDPGICGASRTPAGWTYANLVTAIDPNNTTNLFRGNVTTSNGLDMTHTLCYGTTGAVVTSINGGHTATTDTSSQTNYTAPSAITTGSLTTNINWTGSLALSNETGPNGDTASVGYDSAARPSSTTTPYGASTNFTYSTSPPQTTATVVSNDTNTNGRKTVTKFDGLGRAIEVDFIDAGGTTQSIVQSQYAACGCSPMGKLSKTSRPYRPGDTPVWTTYTYDGLGRTVSILAPDNASTTSYSYVGNTVTTTDAAGNWKKFTMDAFGNLTTVVEPDVSQTNTSNHATTTYTYDALNHLTNVSMPRRMPGGNVVTQTRTFNYVVSSSITAYLQSATNPENGTVSYTYNADGTMATKLDAKGQTLKYAYDSYGRVLTVSLAGSPDTVLRTYTYDTNPADATYSQYASGRLTTVQYSVPSTSTATNQFNQQINFVGDTVTEMYSYTRPGQVSAKRLRVARQPFSGQALIADLNANWDYTSKNEGRLMGVTYPGDPNGIPTAPSYTYAYDAMGRLNTMTDGNGGSVINGAQYNASGQMTSMGSLESRSYNVMGQLTGVTYGSSLSITYNYSSTQNNGKITSQTDNLSGEQVTYAYDSLNRLTSATASSWNQSFVYDPFGSLTDKNGSNSWHGTPDATTNRLGTTDANGNSTTGGLQYDPENRLTSANFNYQQYAYDGQNKRIWAVTWDNTHSVYASETYYFYSPQGKLMAQFTPEYQQQNGTLAFLNGAARSYFGGRLLGSEDRLGSRGKYFPYGEDRSSPPPANDAVKFATYTRDSATGLDYADQRFYSSTYGRFSSPDPYMASGGPSDPGSWNRYAYTRGDPLNGNDPSGRLTCMVDGIDIDCTSGCIGVQTGAYLIADGSGSGGGDFGDGPCGSFGGIFDGGGGGGGGTPPPETKTRRECAIQVWERNVKGPFNLPTPFEHTVTQVIVTTITTLSSGATISSSLYYWLEGYPENGYLNSLGVAFGSPLSSDTGWSPLADGKGNYGYSAALCANADAAIDWATNYPNNTVVYSSLGPNSNSFTFSLLEAAGLIPPSLSHWTYKGWGTQVP